MNTVLVLSILWCLCPVPPKKKLVIVIKISIDTSEYNENWYIGILGHTEHESELVTINLTLFHPMFPDKYNRNNKKNSHLRQK